VAALAFLLAAVLTGCAHAISGTATWPGARLERVVLTAADFPTGVQYDRSRAAPASPTVPRPAYHAVQPSRAARTGSPWPLPTLPSAVLAARRNSRGVRPAHGS
jgi:hypothetical protein